MSESTQAAKALPFLVNVHGTNGPSLKSRRPFALVWSRLRSRLLSTLLDCLAIVGGYAFAGFVYHGDNLSTRVWPDLLVFLVVALSGHVLALHLVGLHRCMWRHAGIKEALTILMSSAAAVTLLVAVHTIHMVDAREEPMGVIVFGGLLATCGVGVLRFRSRLIASKPVAHTQGVRVGVIGSRDAGASAVRDMLNNPGAGLIPVAVFDDDDAGHGLSLLGVPVVGPVASIPNVRGGTGSSRWCWPFPLPRPISSISLCSPPRWPA